MREQLRRKTDATLAELERRRDGEVVTVGGIVSDVKHLTTKRGDPMVFLTLDDPTAPPRSSSSTRPTRSRELCVTDRILVVKGRIDHKQQGETKVIASEVTAFEAVAERREVRSLDAREAPAGVIRELARLVREFPGESPVYLSLSTSEGPKTFALGPEFRVRPDPDFIAEARPCSAAPPCSPSLPTERGLQEDLEGELDRAAALEQRDGAVQVDLGRRREHRSGLGVVAGAPQRVEPPQLDALEPRSSFP